MPDRLSPDQRRAHERTSSIADARIDLDGVWHECRILDVSVGGARLWLECALPATGETWLEIGNFGKFRIRYAWQSGTSAGVRFAHDPAEMAELVMALATYG